MNLPYTEDEICALYRRSANKRVQIQILAQMNLTTKERIIAVLKKNGIEIDYDKLPKMSAMNGLHKTHKPKRSNDDWFLKYKEAVDRNMTVPQAALFLGITQDSVRKYARKHGLQFAKARRGRKVG
jgi:hypothetical protein